MKNVRPLKQLRSPSEEHVEMTISEWAAIPSNPIQRDTAQRAKLANKRHLKVANKVHRLVHAARLPDGSLIKLDGHTRGYLWEKKKLQLLGDRISVTVIPVASVEEAETLYKTFDSRYAVETAADEVTGQFRKHEIELSSTFLHRGRFKTSLQIANGDIHHYNAADLSDIVLRFKKELLLVDSQDFKSNFLSGGALTAMLIWLKKDPTSIAFWTAVHSKAGIKFDGKSDQVEWFIDYHSKVKIARANLGREGILEVALMTLGILRSYKNGKRMMARPPHAFSLQEFKDLIAELKAQE